MIFRNINQKKVNFLTLATALDYIPKPLQNMATTLHLFISILNPAHMSKKYGDLLKVIEWDALKHTFPEKYDIIFCNQIIKHYPKINKFLSEMEHLLAQNGLLILATPNQNTLEYLTRPKWTFNYIFMNSRFHVYRYPFTLWKFLKIPWLCCDPPRHVYAFNHINISNLCLANNLTFLKT